MFNKKIETVNPIQSTFSRDEDAFTALSTSALLAKSSVPYSHRRIADNYVIIKKVCQKVGIQENVGTHTLRKTFGYHHYHKFRDVVILQKIFNHSSP